MGGDGHRDSVSRALALALALFAITFDFLQPLVHAAALRDGTADSRRSMLCSASAAGPAQADGRDRKSADSVDHQCCLGLAHAQIGVAAPQAFVLLSSLAAEIDRPQRGDRSVSRGIRDGPNQPRAPPPSFV
jgi:hypothetical protein